MTDLNVQFFNMLPSELREHIISQRPELIPPFSGLNEENFEI